MVTMPSRSVFRRALAALALTGVLAAIALPAAAHAELISSDPADGASVTELTTIHLEFSEDLLEIGNKVTVTDGAGTEHEATLTFPESNQIDATVTDIAPGAVTIAWRNASVDGHTEEGQFGVTLLAPSPSPSPTPTVTVTATATPSPSPSVTPSASAEPEPAPASGGLPLWIWIALGVLAIAALAAVIAATRKSPSEK